MPHSARNPRRVGHGRAGPISEAGQGTQPGPAGITSARPASGGSPTPTIPRPGRSPHPTRGCSHARAASTSPDPGGRHPTCARSSTTTRLAVHCGAAARVVRISLPCCIAIAQPEYPAQRNALVDEGPFMSELSARATIFGGQGTWETKTWLMSRPRRTNRALRFIDGEPAAYPAAAPGRLGRVHPRRPCRRRARRRSPARPMSPALLRVPVTDAAGILSRRPDLTKSFLASNNRRFHSTLSDRIREMVAVRCRGRPSDRSY